MLLPEHLQSQALLLKLKESQLPLLSLAHIFSIAVAFSTVPPVSYFPPSSLFHLFSTKESRSHKEKQSQEKLTALTPPSPHTPVCEQLLNTGLAESPNRQNSSHYLFLMLFYSTKIILTFLSQEEWGAWVGILL